LENEVYFYDRFPQAEDVTELQLPEPPDSRYSGLLISERPAMTDTAPNRLERRSAQRFEVLLPLAVHFDGRMVPAFTQNLSGRGIFFYSEAAILEGAIVELVFAMPSEVTLGENMPVRCRGRVLRSAPPQPGQRQGIAVQLESYEYLPADEFLPISHVARVSVPSASGIPRPVSR
jgi:hypothetical protein